ncbi:fatty acid desaturase [Actinomycetospora endophytica]|uniref:Fatty acid desaturase n=1 Tax=Actinomycetospora endophytica TaxID=2291215 RepID=A0ABS8PCB8_9PSEU|nr:fatty acid desaturase [Actinomycetospora endophytica]MCD2195873.1 fatty acid desaturase [Actinomycetospora endophytica]
MAEQDSPQSKATSSRKLPKPDEPVPKLSLPAAGLLVGGLALWVGSTAMALAKRWPWPVSTLLNAFASYMLFTVAHDAGHGSLSTSKAVNTALGRVGTAGFAPHVGFHTWKFIHLEHHRHVNNPERDPDHYTERGPAWQRPLRWLTIDLYYVLFYAPKLSSRPRSEQVELGANALLLAGTTAAAIKTGRFHQMVLFVLLPIRLTLMWLGYAFDYLPHHDLTTTARENQFKTTRNRIGFESTLSPAMLFQNYHLVHHLHPRIPFHRYVAAWRRNEEEYLTHEPPLTDVRGRPLTMDEYRARRGLRIDGATARDAS